MRPITSFLIWGMVLSVVAHAQERSWETVRTGQQISGCRGFDWQKEVDSGPAGCVEKHTLQGPSGQYCCVQRTSSAHRDDAASFLKYVSGGVCYGSRTES
jgi:hypothetical protein